MKKIAQAIVLLLISSACMAASKPYICPTKLGTSIPGWDQPTCNSNFADYSFKSAELYDVTQGLGGIYYMRLRCHYESSYKTGNINKLATGVPNKCTVSVSIQLDAADIAKVQKESMNWKAIGNDKVNPSGYLCPKGVGGLATPNDCQLPPIN